MKYVRALSTLSLVIAPLAVASAQSQVEFKPSEISAIRYVASNVGMFGMNPLDINAGFSLQGDAGRSYMFGSGLWFGAHGSSGGNATTGAFITFEPNTATSWACPGEHAPAANLARPVLAGSQAYDRTTGLATRSGLGAWPLWRVAGQVPSMMSPGIHEPDSTRRIAGGVYSGPAFVAGVDEQFTSRFNDSLIENYGLSAADRAGAGLPFGLQMTQNVFSWAGGPFARCVVVQYQVVYVGTGTLTDCYIGSLSDPDIGSAANDHAAWYAQDSTLRALVSWTEPEADTYGLLLSAVIEAPALRGGSSRRIDNAARADVGRQLGLTTCRRLNIAEDPRKPAERYQVMADGRRDADQGSGDVRALQGCGPFTLQPGDTAYFAILYAVVDGTYPLTQATQATIAGTVRGVRELYYNGIASGVAIEIGAGSGAGIEAAPNPSNGLVTLRGELPGAAGAELTVIDALGRTVETRIIDVVDGRFGTTIDLSAAANGMYVARVRSGDDMKAITIEHIR